MDGVNSMTGNAPDLAAFADLAREHDALLYVDDAHGFGVIGERAPHEFCDYGIRGNCSSRHLDEPTTMWSWSPVLEGVLVAAGLPRPADRG